MYRKQEKGNKNKVMPDSRHKSFRSSGEPDGFRIISFILDHIKSTPQY